MLREPWRRRRPRRGGTLEEGQPLVPGQFAGQVRTGDLGQGVVGLYAKYRAARSHRGEDFGDAVPQEGRQHEMEAGRAGIAGGGDLPRKIAGLARRIQEASVVAYGKAPRRLEDEGGLYVAHRIQFFLAGVGWKYLKKTLLKSSLRRGFFMKKSCASTCTLLPKKLG